MAVFQLLAINAAVSAACFIVLWLIGLATRDVSFVDAWWGLGMVVLAVSSFLQTGAPTPHRLVLTLMCALWGLRLGGYLLMRWRGHGPDARYQTLLANGQIERGWGFALSSLLLVFALQAPLQFILALPVQLGAAAPSAAPLGLVGWAGLALAAFGLGFETLGDLQLAAFKANAANAGKVMDRGLWRYTRHPNYFGEAVFWWGLYLIAAETRWGSWSLPGPLLVTFLLTRFSGVPTVEGRMRQRPQYEAYVASTPAFVPWFPKKAP